MEEEISKSKLQLPEAFVDFLVSNGLNPSIYSATDAIPRYIRLKPGREAEIEEFKAEMECKIEKVDWLPGFYSLPHGIHIANSKAYREGKIHGNNAASGAAVSALNTSAGDHVLDLCAAPGAKLCMMSDLLGDSGSVTGRRCLKSSSSSLQDNASEYESANCCRLFVADGITFSLVPIRDHPDFSERYYRSWWSHHNYVLSGALDAGLAFMGVLLFLCLGMEHVRFKWWGNDSEGCPLASCPTQQGVVVKGCPVL